MSISQNLVRRFQEEYRRKYGQDISNKEAERNLYDLSTLIRLVAKERSGRHGR